MIKMNLFKYNDFEIINFYLIIFKYDKFDNLAGVINSFIMFSDMILSRESSHRIFLLDTETTGLIENGEYPAVIQIAVLDGQSDQFVNSFVRIGLFIQC
jgi:hypothetical protein